MFRQFRRNMRQQAALDNSPTLERITQANQSLNAGHFAESGALFASAALEMENTQHPRRAANLHAQAAHAFASAKDEIRSLSHARAALNLFIQYQMLNRAPQFYANIIRKLRANGLQVAAAQLEHDFSSQIPAPTAAASSIPAVHRGQLPSACPQCGAPVRSDEIEWVDATSAECIFCGSILKTKTY